MQFLKDGYFEANVDKSIFFTSDVVNITVCHSIIFISKIKLIGLKLDSCDSKFSLSAISLWTNFAVLTLLHSARPKLYGVLTVQSAIGLNSFLYKCITDVSVKLCNVPFAGGRGGGMRGGMMRMMGGMGGMMMPMGGNALDQVLMQLLGGGEP